MVPVCDGGGVQVAMWRLLRTPRRAASSARSAQRRLPAMAQALPPRHRHPPCCRCARALSLSPTPPHRCPYQLLGIRPTDDADTIKRAFREKALALHPDRRRSQQPGSEAEAAAAMEEFNAVVEAFEKITRSDKDWRYRQEADFAQWLRDELEWCVCLPSCPTPHPRPLRFLARVSPEPAALARTGHRAAAW